MGAAARARPKYLSAKLRLIRGALGLSQTEMGKRLGFDDEFARNYVSGYERNTREPTLDVLLRYSEISGCWMNALVDDEVELPDNLPCRPMHEGVRRKPAIKTSRKR